MIKLIECPRDAMQGMLRFVPTSLKVTYIQSLLEVGFDTIDFGSFVSPRAIPQLRDTHEVIQSLDLSQTQTKLLAIIANIRGAEDAVAYKEIDYLGYPFSISNTFQRRNTNTTIEKSLDVVKHIQSLCINNGKKLVLYLSMGFGNPYGDEWSVDIVKKWIERLNDEIEVEIISLSDTIGIAKPNTIQPLFSELISSYKQIEFGAHFHTTPDSWYEKIDAASKGGCTRFDGALGGFGGCPMAKEELTGNMNTHHLLRYFSDKVNIDKKALEHATYIASSIF